MRQAGDIYLNGKQVGLYENGVTAYGIDITDAPSIFGDKENVLAVKLDNTTTYKERATGTAVPSGTPTTSIPTTAVSTAASGSTSPAKSTRPCRSTTASRARASTSTPATSTSRRRPPTSPSKPKSATPPATAPPSASPSRSSISNGQLARSSTATRSTWSTAKRACSLATGTLKYARFWSPDDPYLYDVYTILTVDGKVVDVSPHHHRLPQGRVQRRRGHRRRLHQRQIRLPQRLLPSAPADEWAGLGARLSRLDARLHRQD